METIYRCSRVALMFLLIFTTSTGLAATTLVAVASNFNKPMTEIADAFAKATGHNAALSFGSSGKFVAQLENDAPFEVFLSADADKPLQLEQAGLTVEGSRYTYALGKLVLWSATPGFVDAQGNILNKGGFKHLAMADPKLAPYGVAAQQVLKTMKLEEKLQSLLVLGENISQTYQFVSTGNAELGFVALSQVSVDGKITEGSAWVIPDKQYVPIQQDMVLMKKGATNPAAVALMAFLKSASAQTIIQKYGYALAQ